MATIETIALLVALITFIVVVAAFVLYRRDPTVRAVSQILHQRRKARNALQEQFGDALEPTKLLMTVGNLIGPDQNEYQRKLTLIGALVVYELEKCNRIRAAFDRTGWPSDSKEPQS